MKSYPVHLIREPVHINEIYQKARWANINSKSHNKEIRLAKQQLNKNTTERNITLQLNTTKMSHKLENAEEEGIV